MAKEIPEAVFFTLPWVCVADGKSAGSGCGLPRLGSHVISEEGCVLSTRTDLSVGSALASQISLVYPLTDNTLT